MRSQEVSRIGQELATVGHTITSFEKLGIEEFGSLATNLRETVETTPHFLQERTDHTGMIMCKDKASKHAGSAVMRPVVEVLFPEEVAVDGTWDMYTVNYYFDPGHFFKPHQDYLDGGTVVIICALGSRKLDIYEKGEDDVFGAVEVSYELNKGQILLLDGAKDLGHAAICLTAPSISVVGDIASTVQPQAA